MRKLAFSSCSKLPLGSFPLWNPQILRGFGYIKPGTPTSESFGPTIFDKIISREIPAQIVYEDEEVLSFLDVSPQAPFHALLIPKEHNGLTRLIYAISDRDWQAEEKHERILGKMMRTIPIIARQNNLEEGYRIVINDGRLGGQTVYHLHIHILGKAQMFWPPGTPGPAADRK